MRIDKLNFAYGDKVIFKDFDMDVTDKKIVCIMGASGCGKTTLLNCVCGRSDHGGIIDLGGEAEEKKIAYVFQQPRLIPSLTVEDNIDYVLPRSMSKAERTEKVNNILSAMRLEDCRKSYPRFISGGQAGRASLARAFVTDCGIMLMDEPFKGLDIRLKTDILKSITPLLENKTTLFVTHDVEEALIVADSVCVLDKTEEGDARIVGRIEIAEPKAERNICSPRLNDARKQITELLL